MKKTKIICTIGPSCEQKEDLKKLASAGMDCARINTAHGDFQQYKKIVKKIKSVSPFLPIMLDIKGPEIRVRLKNELKVSKNRIFRIGFKRKSAIHFSANFYNQVKQGQKIFFDNGIIETLVVEKKDGELVLKSLADAVIKPNKGVNIPNTEINIPALSEKDKQVINFAIKNNIAFIALSFARNEKDVLNLRKMLKGKKIGLIAKIENHQGIKNFDKILEHSEGIMIARGDLGVEIIPEKIPLLQKEMIRKCNQAGKIVITATQMLESMILNPVPTRAETSDVANAILDGSDAVMLSGETAVGKFPIEAVHVMVRIANEIEPKIISNVKIEASTSVSEEIAHAIFTITNHLKADKIICLTKTGFTARMISRYRLNVDIIAITVDRKLLQQLQLVYGVKPIIGKWYKSKSVIRHVKRLYDQGMLKNEDVIIFTSGTLSSFIGMSNRIEVHHIGDMMTYVKKHDC